MRYQRSTRMGSCEPKTTRRFTMHSYASALKLYNNLTKPPRSKWWREQPDNAKPLVNVGTRNKSIHMTDSGVIYFKFYNTKIASFVNDPASNTYTAVMRYYHSVSTNSFMMDYGLHYAHLRTDPSLDNYVYIPYKHTYDKPSAVLTFDATTDMLLTDLDKSWHPTLYTKRSNEEDKQARAHVRKSIEPYVTMALFNIHNTLEVAVLQAEAAYAAPFFSVERDAYNNKVLEPLRNFRRTLTQFAQSTTRAGGMRALEFPFDSEDFINGLLRAIPAMCVLSLSHAADRYLVKEADSRYKYYEKWRGAVEKVAAEFDTLAFGKRITQQVITALNIDRGTTDLALPLFRHTRPSKAFSKDFDCPTELSNKFSNV